MRIPIAAPETKPMFDAWGFSPAVLSGDLLFIGGQVGMRPDGSAPEDPSMQIALAFENMGKVLKAAQALFDDVVDVTAFYTDYAQHGRLARPIREAVFGTQAPPNWTAVGVAALAEPFVFEVKAIARMPEK